MSSALRISIILVLLLATTAFGLIAYNMNLPKAQAPVEVAEKAPAPTVGYFVAARPLPKGTLARAEDFIVRSVTRESVPKGAIVDTGDAKAGLPGSLVRKFVDAGSPVTLQDLLRPRDRGFLASVLGPDSRAISVKVDEESGVSGLIRPGDYVDVVLTQVFEKADPGRRAMSETVLRNVRIIAIDQEIAQGEGRNANTATAKPAQTVSLELTPEQVKKITVAKHIGTLSLSVRSAADQWDLTDTGAASSCDVSPEFGQNTAVVVHAGGEVKQYSVRKQDLGDSGNIVSCDEQQELARQTAAAGGYAGKLPEKR
jgi:pilus assembly protein CpaB